jgi:hypothetical protein
LQKPKHYNDNRYDTHGDDYQIDDPCDISINAYAREGEYPGHQNFYDAYNDTDYDEPDERRFYSR